MDKGVTTHVALATDVAVATDVTVATDVAEGELAQRKIERNLSIPFVSALSLRESDEKKV